MSGAKDLLYKGSMIKETSQNLKHLGEMWNIDSLSQEGAKNEKNPGRAIGKAAAYTAGAYLGGLLGGAGGAAGGAGTETAVNSAAALGDAEQAAVQAGMQTAPQAAPMYSSSLLSTAPGPGVVAPGMKYPAMADTALINAGYPEMAGGKVTGLLAQGSGSPSSKLALRQTMSSMQPQQAPQQQQRPTYAPPQQQPPMLPYGMSEEEKQRLRMMGYQV
jgi:hypothetical protein